MACLEHFNGWISDTEEAESCIRTLVSQLKLRPLAEPGDVDSPLLRSQIDKQYLRAMAQARAQMAGNTEERNNKNNKAPTTRIKNASTNKSNKSSFDAVKLQDVSVACRRLFPKDCLDHPSHFILFKFIP
jgi:hypothetical protein